ncbi:nuclear RNA export factor 1-like [Tropilaelaps mercedesae]|uniref:Nuclear RNA export factor 1-like n=1 Tax=Tropilaelaps mercedesae TaxID=418985 RepID=A0A1V9XHY3_9ACAR|nr:nuclear RNA export factor 1-like [Tropilaelaps mercedesae]
MKKFNRNRKGPRPLGRGRCLDEDGDAVMDGAQAHKDAGRHGGSGPRRYASTPNSRFGSLVNRMKPLNNRNKQRFAYPNCHPSIDKQMCRDLAGDTWYRILIPNGRRLGQEFIVRELTAKCPIPFSAMNFHMDQQCATFYVNSCRVSNAFRKLNGTISTEDGVKMSIIVRVCDLPQVTLTEFAENAIKLAMSSRYDTNTRFLNLSKFEIDKSLVEAGLFLPLSRVNVANFVVAVITDHIPELEGLDFSNNSIYNISCLAPLAVKCKELKTLKLAGNKIRHVKDLDALKGLPVTEAAFAGCPFTERYKEEDAYVRGQAESSSWAYGGTSTAQTFLASSDWPVAEVAKCVTNLAGCPDRLLRASGGWIPAPPKTLMLACSVRLQQQEAR